MILAMADPWREGRWAAVHGRSVERFEMRPSTYFLKTPEAVARLLRDAAPDERSNPLRRPTKPDGSPDRQRLHVGVVRIGGKGDDLMTGAHCIAFKRRFSNAHITLFARDNTGHLAGHRGVDRLVFGGNFKWREIARDLREHFDLFVDLCYVPKVWAFHPDLEEYARECREKFEPLAWYYWNAFASNQRLAGLGRNLIVLANEVACLPGSVNDVTMALRPGDRKIARTLLQAVGDYVTLHNGSACNRQTKCWPTAHWARVVAALHERGVTAVQIGAANEEPVPGAIDLRGTTTLGEAAGVIEGARLHLDTEGGPVHMAKAVGTRAVVLFGPTPAVCFGYPGHVAIETPMPCRGCWYASDRWHLECPAGHSRALCMEAITADTVMEVVSRELEGAERRGEPCSAGLRSPLRRAKEPPCSPAPLSFRGAAEESRNPGPLASARGDTAARLSGLAIAVPTRNRPEALARLLESIARQTAAPERILVVNDGEEPVHRLLTFPRPGRGQGDACATVPAETIEGPRKGPHFAHQAALAALGDPVVSGAEPCEFILRLDDDLVLESPDFIERLYRLAASDERIGAVGGVYIQPEFEGRIADAEMIGRRGYSTTVAGMLRGENSAQFYRYDEARTVEAEHLYSSFLYRREAMLEVGGFALCYSARGHREETDATHRLHLAGWKLLIDTGAVGRHERCAIGGLRDLASPEELEAMRFSDEALFLERLRGGELGGPRCHSEPKARNLVRDPSLRSG